MSKKDQFKYKSDFSLEERKQESARILRDHPNRMPVICEKAPNSTLPDIKKTKYLVPGDMSVNQFHFLIRRNLDLNEASALYLITPKGVTLTGDKTIMDHHRAQTALYRARNEVRFLPFHRLPSCRYMADCSLSHPISLYQDIMQVHRDVQTQR